MGKQSHSIKVKDYIKLSEEDKEFVDYTIRNSLKSNSILKVGFKKKQPKELDFWELTWEDLIMIRNYVSENNMEGALELLYDVKPNRFFKLDLFNCSSVYKWINEQLLEINKIEKKELGEPTEDDKNAGVEELQKYGYYVALDVITKENMLDEEKTLKIPYKQIFRKLCLKKDRADIQRNHSENVSRKNKANSR